MAAVGYQRVVIDTAMFFGLFVTVTMALNFQYGNAGVPNMGARVNQLSIVMRARNLTSTELMRKI